MEFDKLIRGEIFKKVVETTPIYKYIMKNPQIEIDERVFLIKYEREEAERYTGEDIINLYIGEEIADYEEEESSKKIVEQKEPEPGYSCIIF